jgi:hypothetical protein
VLLRVVAPLGTTTRINVYLELGVYPKNFAREAGWLRHRRNAVLVSWDHHWCDREDRLAGWINVYLHPMRVRAAEGLDAGEILEQLAVRQQRLVHFEEVRIPMHQDNLSWKVQRFVDNDV